MTSRATDYEKLYVTGFSPSVIVTDKVGYHAMLALHDMSFLSQPQSEPFSFHRCQFYGFRK